MITDEYMLIERRQMKSQASGSPLLVFCAASVEPAVVPIAAAFQRETGVAVQFEVGPSGPLIEKMRREKRGDLFIPASQQPFLDRCQSDGTVTEVVRLATMTLVLAVKPGKPAAITFKDLLVGGFLSMLLFVGILLLGLGYAWRKGVLTWK